MAVWFIWQVKYLTMIAYDIAGQSRQVFANIDKALALAGTDKNHLLSAQVFIKIWRILKALITLGKNGWQAQRRQYAQPFKPTWSIQTGLLKLWSLLPLNHNPKQDRSR